MLFKVLAGAWKGPKELIAAFDQHILDKVADLSPKNMFGNNPPQMVPIAGSKYWWFPGFGGFDPGPNLQP